MNIKNIRQILVLILILASFIFFFPWGGTPTAPEAYEPNLKPSHILDAELPHSLQQAGVRALPQQYVEHEPIRIAKNEDFAALGFPGVGTPFTPYLIEGLNITSATRTLIRIKDTTAYFCIRNNLLNGSTDWDLIKWDYPLKEAYGIKLKHVTHGTIDSNLVINCERGILLNQSEQNTLINNTVAHNYDYGISLEHSKYSTITHNTVANNHFKAISLANSGHSTLTQNNITNNMEGISLWESEHSTVANNTVSNGGIRILKSGNTTVVHNTVSNCEFGISIVSNTTIVAHNTVSNCGTGIWLSHSKYSTITNNTVSQNKYIGIRLSESGFNTIANNTISHNRDAGIKLHVSGNNTLLENRLINNGLVFDFYLSLGPLTRHGYRLMPVQHHIQATVAENVVNGRPLIYWQNVRGGTVPPGAGQVVLMNTTGVEVTGQDLTQANIGVFAAFSLHLDIHHNTLFNNTLFGIALEYSNHSTIAHNTLYNNSRYGISLESSKYSTIAHNTVTNGGGISLEQSGHSTVINNTVSNCGDGIHLWDSGNTTLANNTIHITPHRLSALTITYPNGGETLQGTVTLQWTPTNDSWEHSVTYTVSYSADDGHPWILLASGLSTSEYEWDTTTVADGFAYRIQVVATCSEGLMAVDVSNTPFIIQNSAATTTVGAFPNPGEPIGILLATLLLAMNAVRRGKRKSR